MKKLTASLLAIAIGLGGCATSSKDVATAYVSPMQYQSYDCDQLASESQRLQVRVTQLGGRLDEAASNDKAITGVGMILFWPALFALGGTKQQEAEYARLKGEYDAIQQAATLKKCPGLFPVAQTAKPATAPVATPEPAAQPIAPSSPAPSGPTDVQATTQAVK
ncbi:hypothetical protein [Hydrogenophaga sp. OTU3427]|uniref:hypothetical protein n=1 Tax=Hydrogenophaga sp. OTU3427 TaxID=3043856 RepID=UPI00313EF3D1